MHHAAYTYIAQQASQLGRRAFVVELGSRDVNGGIRHLFDSTRYVGVDCVPGPGVDIVADAALYEPDASPDVIVCAETLEHAPGAAAICRHAFDLLAPGGVFIVTAAGLGRLPHSAIDGGPLRQGEFYRNVMADELERWLDGFIETAMVVNPAVGDIYARAVKP
jgi:SAM-dependent methyltransferase